MIDPTHMRDHVIMPTLCAMGDQFCSASSIRVLFGTCIQESLCGTYLKQLKHGPAVGIYQMEPMTYCDIINNYLIHRPKLCEIVYKTCNFNHFPDASEMIANMRFATVMARMHYYRVKERLPDCEDLKGIAKYWKKYYNTELGKGTVDEFIKNYKSVAP